MTTINDLSKIDRMIEQGYGASPSAEDQYLTQVDEQAESNPVHFPTGQRFTRTVVHHYRLATVVETTQVISNPRRNSIIHIYH